MYFDIFSTEKEIKERFRLLAKRLHPDVGGDKVIMQEINEAYELALNRVKEKPFEDDEDRYFKRKKRYKKSESKPHKNPFADFDPDEEQPFDPDKKAPEEKTFTEEQLKGFEELRKKLFEEQFSRQIEKVLMVLDWAKDHPKFETTFMDSLLKRLMENKTLSEAQEKALNNVIDKFKITEMAKT